MTTDDLLALLPSIMLVLTFLLGVVILFTGVSILAKCAHGRDLPTLAAQTTRLAQKGLTEEVAGLVGNAAALMGTLNEVLRTTTGIGSFLVVTGGILIVLPLLLIAKCWL
jgi:hypothetical protein